jgi:mannose-6-phosphate isomerase-like protein (cupin superfamily)
VREVRVKLPGGIGVSHLRVYDGGGTPHLHTACTEAYAVVGGTGAVQTLTLKGGFEETPLEKGALVSFSPGTIHRLVNGGDLEIFVLMSNAGLPEAGDMVITFEALVLADPAKYAEAHVLPTQDLEAAMRRRERAMAGFTRLRAGGESALRDFHEAAGRIIETYVPTWRDRLPVDDSSALLDALETGDVSHLADASVEALDREKRFGCCGTLGQFITT